MLSPFTSFNQHQARSSPLLSALETFDLESFILIFDSLAATHVSNDSDENAITAPKHNPDYTRWKKLDRFVLHWLKTTLFEWALSLIVGAPTSFEGATTLEKSF